MTFAIQCWLLGSIFFFVSTVGKRIVHEWGYIVANYKLYTVKELCRRCQIDVEFRDAVKTWVKLSIWYAIIAVGILQNIYVLILAASARLFHIACKHQYDWD